MKIHPHFTTRWQPLLSAMLLLALVLGGCTGASADQTVGVVGPLPKPDTLVIRDLCVTAAEVEREQGIQATAARVGEGKEVSAEEARIGHLLAEHLAKALVEELRELGIPAQRANADAKISETAAVLRGEFVTLRTGIPAKRPLVGFGLNESKIHTRIQVLQNGRVVAAGETTTLSGIKPGMVSSASATPVSEKVLDAIVTDARNTAREIGKEVKKAYVRRGWIKE